MSAVAPRTFNQLRFFTAFFTGTVGFYTGNSQKNTNQAAWDGYYAAKFKEQAARQDAATAAKRAVARPGVHPDVPEGLEEIVKTLSGE